MVLALTSTEWVAAQLMHSSMSSENVYYHSHEDLQISTNKSNPFVRPWVLSTSRFTSFEQTVNAPSKVALFAAMEEDFNSLTARKCQIEANATSASSRSSSASSFLALAQTKWWLLSHCVPLVPWPGHLTTFETPGADLIPFPAQRMNTHEVPCCLVFLVSKFTRECLPGSKNGQRPRHLAANLPEYVAKQVPCQFEEVQIHHKPFKYIFIRKNGTKRWDNNIVRVCVKASPAEGRRRLHTNTARLLGFNRPSCGASPAFGDAPHEGLLKVEKRGFRVGFMV